MLSIYSARRSVLRGLSVTLLVAALGSAGFALQARGQGAPPETGQKVREIHDACTQAGLAVDSVRFVDGHYEVVMQAGHQSELAQAETIMNQILSQEPIVIVVDNVSDALVVLQFEPGNVSARAVVKARYQQLRAAASQH